MLWAGWRCEMRERKSSATGVELRVKRGSRVLLERDPELMMMVLVDDGG